MSQPLPPAESNQPLQPYPLGENARAYRWAFTAWLVLFLLVICAGLLNYLGTYLKTR